MKRALQNLLVHRGRQYFGVVYVSLSLAGHSKKSIFGLPDRENGGRLSTEKVEKCAGRETRYFCVRDPRKILQYCNPESIVKYEYFCVRVYSDLSPKYIK